MPNIKVAFIACWLAHSRTHAHTRMHAPLHLVMQHIFYVFIAICRDNSGSRIDHEMSGVDHEMAPIPTRAMVWLLTPQLE